MRLKTTLDGNSAPYPNQHETNDICPGKVLGITIKAIIINKRFKQTYFTEKQPRLNITIGPDFLFGGVV